MMFEEYFARGFHYTVEAVKQVDGTWHAVITNETLGTTHVITGFKRDKLAIDGALQYIEENRP